MNVAGVGVAGAAVDVGIVGVTSPSLRDDLLTPFISSCDFVFVRKTWSTGEWRDANSCAPNLGGGKNADPGEGNGELDEL